MHTKTRSDSSDMKTVDLIPFFIITFTIAWGILALYIFAPAQSTRWFGELSGNHPLFYLAVYAPAIAALTMVLWKKGLLHTLSFLSRIKIWGLSRGWTLFLVLIVPTPFFLGAIMEGRLASWSPESIPILCSSMLMMLIKGPVEEIGWRGFAQPLLQRKMCPLAVAIVMGTVWGIWHFPAFLLSGTPQSAWNFGAFFVGTIALSTILTPLYNLSKGSLLVPIVFHFQMINPLWPDGQPTDTLFFVLMAIIITAWNWEIVTTRQNAVTTVIPTPRKEMAP